MRGYVHLFAFMLLTHCSADEGGVAPGKSAAGGNAGTSGGDAGLGGSSSGGTSGTGGGVIQQDGAACVPTHSTETECDGVDDDCNGRVDDVDVAKDGICDCLRIGIIGSPGSNPSANFQAWLQGKGTSVERTHQTASESFDAPLLSKYDVLILDRLPRDYTAAEASALAAWVDAGGGFISMTGYTGQAAPDFFTNTLLAPFGLSYQPGLKSEPVTTFATHPVTQGLTSVTFLGGYLVADAGGTSGTSTVIGSISAGPVAYAHERGKGRAVVWGDEWIEFDSEWQSLPEIEQLWINVMSWLGPQDSCNVSTPR
ncbi:MAG: hypothetical protein R3B13_10345 [Polyangiaceae bacterium]